LLLLVQFTNSAHVLGERFDDPSKGLESIADKSAHSAGVEGFSLDEELHEQTTSQAITAIEKQTRQD
jgi:hypothetical protein